VESYRATLAEMAASALYLVSDVWRWVDGTRLVVDNTMSIISGVAPAPAPRELRNRREET
jgi:hypothetical protein